MTSSMETPLMASPDDGENERPASLWRGAWLHQHHVHTPEQEESEFTRLLEKNVGNPILPLLEDSDEPPDANMLLHPPTTTSADTQNQFNGNNSSDANVVLIQRGPWIVIVAGTCSLLFLGFVWGSYMAPVWMDWQLTVKLQGLAAAASFSSTTTGSWTVESTNLASLLQTMDAATQQSMSKIVLPLLLWTASLIVPCVFMVLAPAWIVRDATQPVSLLQRMRGGTSKSSNARNVLELMVRWSLLTIYVICILSWMTLGAWHVQWTQTGTVLSLHATAQSGLLAYATGVGAALVALAVLRWPASKASEISTARARPERLSSFEALTMAEPWRLVDPIAPNNTSMDAAAGLALPSATIATEPAIDEAPPMTPLEDEPPPVGATAGNNNEQAAAAIPQRTSTTDDAPSTNDTTTITTAAPNESSATTRSRMSWRSVWRRCCCCCCTRNRTVATSSSWSCSVPLMRQLIVFQTGLLSLVLWLPALGLPVVHWTYRGVLSHLDDGGNGAAAAMLTDAITATSQPASRRHHELMLYQMPMLLWKQGRAAGTPVWGVGLIWILLVTTVLIIPVVATFLAIGVWVRRRAPTTTRGGPRVVEDSRSSWYRSWLYCLHPAVGSIVFALALLVTIPTLASWSRVALLDGSSNSSSNNNDNTTTAGLCSRLVLGQDCLSVQADFMPGMWVYLVHSLALEFFVVLTLWWS